MKLLDSRTDLATNEHALKLVEDFLDYIDAIGV